MPPTPFFDQPDHLRDALEARVTTCRLALDRRDAEPAALSVYLQHAAEARVLVDHGVACDQLAPQEGPQWYLACLGTQHRTPRELAEDWLGEGWRLLDRAALTVRLEELARQDLDGLHGAYRIAYGWLVEALDAETTRELSWETVEARVAVEPVQTSHPHPSARGAVAFIGTPPGLARASEVMLPGEMHRGRPIGDGACAASVGGGDSRVVAKGGRSSHNPDDEIPW